MANLEYLPTRCYSKNAQGLLVMIHRGQMGYCTAGPDGETANALNAYLGVSPAGVDIMVGGSMFGWETPLVQDYINTQKAINKEEEAR